MITSYASRAADRLEAVRTARESLDDLYADPQHDRRKVAALHDHIRVALKMAEVEALLNVGHQLEKIATTLDGTDLGTWDPTLLPGVRMSEGSEA